MVPCIGRKRRAIARVPILSLVLMLFAPPASAADIENTVSNLQSFAKLYGYVRFFHPSDEAARLDWERFAIHGAGRVADIPPNGSVEAELNSLFRPIAPSMTMAAEVPLAQPTVEPLPECQIVAWQHSGVWLGGRGIYRSLRTNRPRVKLYPGAFGGMHQSIDGKPLRGKQIRLTAGARAEVVGTPNQLQFWLRVDRTNSRRLGFFDNMRGRPIRANAWRTYHILADVADDAERISFGAFLSGEGRAWVDHFLLQVSDGRGGWRKVPIDNATFDSDGIGARPAGWAFNAPGYSFTVSAEQPCADGRSVLIEGPAPEPNQPLFDSLPRLTDATIRQIYAGLWVTLPVALRSCSGHTVPNASLSDIAALDEALSRVDLHFSTAADRDVRLGAVVIAWNVLQHFYPYFDVVSTDWDAVLPVALTRALQDKTEEEFRETLKWLVVQLRDGHAGVFNPRLDRDVALPVKVTWIGEDAVVTANASEAQLQLGDVLLSLDGVPVQRILEDLSRSRSGSPQWIRAAAAASDFGLGPPGSIARVVVQRGRRRLSFAVKRTSAARPTVVRAESLQEVCPGIYYVDLATSSIADIEAATERLAGAKGVIFDVRDYPLANHQALGYLTSEPIRSARFQVPQRLYPDRRELVGYDESGRWLIEPKEPRLLGRIVFLSDEGVISAGESILGIVEEYSLGTIVGATTAGANGNVNAIPLPGGFHVTFTGMRVLKHDGSQHHLVGIEPDVRVVRSVEGTRAGKDETLEAALRLLSDAD